MSMSDPISDLLTRIRNAARARQDRIDVPASRLKEELCTVLKREGYLADCQHLSDERQGVLRLTLKFGPDGKPVVKGLRRVSKPSLRVYVKSADIQQVRSGLGISIMSTPKGLMTGKQARASHIGGEVLCEVW
ncbi:MAG: 30S ribosomal protein S8 [Candidatus Hydrogenedentota bacterium]